MLGKIKKLLQSKKIEILVIIIFLLLSLRVVTWFEHPNILISGDYRPQLNQEAFTNRITYTWDQTDLGMTSIYTPRILVPSYLLMTIFNILGTNTYTSQITTLTLMMFLTSTLTYILTKKLLNQNTTAALIAGIYITSNIYMIVDREISAIAFMDVVVAILPCLIVFTEGLIRKSNKLMAISGLLFVFSYGPFPNYRNPMTCLLLIGLIVIFKIIENGLRTKQEKSAKIMLFPKSKCVFEGIKNIGKSASDILRQIPFFVITAVLSSIWIIMILLVNWDVFTQTQIGIGTPDLVFNTRIEDVLRLIPKWSFYQGHLGNPYVPYAGEYIAKFDNGNLTALGNPLIIFLSYLPPIIAFASLLISKSRKAAGYFSLAAITFLALTAHFGLPPIYKLITSNLLLLPFREPQHWGFFVVICFSILIGITISSLLLKFRRIIPKAIILSLTVIVLLTSAYPLTNGDVSTNYLYPDKKGVNFPESYSEMNNALSQKYWTLILPQTGTYITYDFGGARLGLGNPYPLIFSKPIISGLGTEYMQSNNKELIEKIYETMGINLVEKAVVTASSFKNASTKPDYAIDQNNTTTWTSKTGLPQVLQINWSEPQNLNAIKVIFEDEYQKVNYTLTLWNNSDKIIELEKINYESLENIYKFENIYITRIEVNFDEFIEKNTNENLTIPKAISIQEIGVYTPNNEIADTLGMLGIKNIINQKNIASGDDINLIDFNIIDTPEITLLKDWEEATLYENKNAHQKIYTANTTKTYTTINDLFNQTKNTPWTTLQHTTYIHTNTTKNTNIPNNLQTPQNLTWQQNNPTKYTITTTTNNPFILALLESYDTNWKATINGNTIPEENHIQINGYANAWIIQQTGQLTITIEYTPQNTFTLTIIASITLPTLLLITTLNIKQIKKQQNKH